MVEYPDLQSISRMVRSNNLNTRYAIKGTFSIRAFFRFLLIEGEIEENPASLIESPKIGLKLPEVLSIIEIDRIIDQI